MKLIVIIFILLSATMFVFTGCESGDGSGSGDFTLGIDPNPTNCGTSTPTNGGTPVDTPSLTPTEQPCEEIVWEQNWDKVIETSQKENKIVMVYFYTDVCPACRQLERTALSDTKVNTFLCQNFITVKSNSNKSSLHTYFGDIRFVPTVLFMTPDGFEIGNSRLVGAKSATAFLDWITSLQDFWSDHLETTGVS